MSIKDRIKKLERVRITKGLLPTGNIFNRSMSDPEINAFLNNFI